MGTPSSVKSWQKEMTVVGLVDKDSMGSALLQRYFEIGERTVDPLNLKSHKIRNDVGRSLASCVCVCGYT